MDQSRGHRRKERESNPQGSSLARFRTGCRRPSACPSESSSSGGRNRTCVPPVNRRRRPASWIRSSPTALAESSASVMSPSSIDSKIWTPLWVGGAGRAAGPHAGVAVGLELEPDRVAGRAVLGADLAHRAEQVLDVVAELVGEDVRLHEVTALAAELSLEDVLEERRVEVDGLVGRAVERPDVGAGAAAAGRRAAGEGDDLRGLELLAGLLGQHLGPVALQRQRDRLRARSPRSRWRPHPSGTARSGRSSRAGPSRSRHRAASAGELHDDEDDDHDDASCRCRHR